MANRLTVNCVDLTDDPIGAEVIITLPGNARTLTEQVARTTLTAHANHLGVAVFDLIPTSELVGTPLYSIRVASGRATEFAMPASDTTLNALLALPDPTNVQQVVDGRLVPPGGVSGDALVKSSAADYDTEWAAAGGAGAGLSEAQVKAEIKGFAQADQPTNLVSTADIDDRAIVGSKLAVGSVGSDIIAANAVSLGKIADAAVQTSKLGAGVVTTPKIANDAVTQDKLANNSVGSDQILANAVTETELEGAVEGRLIPDGGTTNQVLAKASNTDHDVEWQNPATGGTGGLNQAQVRAEIRPFAQTSQTTRIATGDIADAAITGAKIASNAVTAAKILADNVTQAKIAPSAVGTTELADDGVTTGKIADNAVTRPKIPDNAISDTKISDGSVTTNKIRNLGVTTGKIANLAVTDGKLATATQGRLIPSGGTQGQVLKKDTGTDYDVSWQNDETGGGGGGGLSEAQVKAEIKGFAQADQPTNLVSTADIDDDAITAAKIATGAVVTDGIGNNAVTSAKIGSNAVTAAKIAANAVGASELADNAVDTAAIANNAVTRPKIPNGTIGDAQISDQSVTSAKIRNLGVTTGKLADDAITAAKLASNAVVTASIVDDAVTIDKIANAVVNRLLPGGGGTGQVLKKDTGTDYDVSWQDDETSTGGAGITLTQARNLISLWARDGNTDQIPANKLGNAPGAAPTIITANPSAAGTGLTGGNQIAMFGSWHTIVETASNAITSSNAGTFLCIGNGAIVRETAASGGGDRSGIEMELIRVRGAATQRISRMNAYVRALQHGTTAPVDSDLYDLMLESNANIIGAIDLAANDTVRLRFRAANQTAGRVFGFNTTDNFIQLIHW